MLGHIADRILCWIHGHDWEHFTGYSECDRCGKIAALK